MLFSQIPSKFPLAFGASAVPSDINPIPATSQIGIVGGAASLPDGFPPLTFLPVGAGGIPPWGRDFNGLFNQISAWIQFSDNAGCHPTFDPTFSSQVGGYPQGALLRSLTESDNTLYWLSLIDNNTTNPDLTVNGSGLWYALGFVTHIQNEAYISGDDNSVTPNLITFTTNPPIASYVAYQRFQVRIANTTTGSTLGSVLVNITGISGALGARNLVYADGSAPIPFMVTANEIAMIVYDGVNFQLENTYPTLKIPIGGPILYVRTDGNDNNTGLTNTPTGAMRHITAAIARASNIYALQGKVLTIQMGIAGTYDWFIVSGISGSINVQGDPNNQANYLLTGTSISDGAIVVTGTQVNLIGCTVVNSQNQNGVVAAFGGFLNLTHVTFTQPSGTNSFGVIAAQSGGSVAINSVIINCSAQEGIIATTGNIVLAGGVSVTFGAGVSFPQGTVYASSGGGVTWNQSPPMVFGGSTPTGPRFTANLNGVINTNTANINYIPGTTAGTTGTGGVYN